MTHAWKELTLIDWLNFSLWNSTNWLLSKEVSIFSIRYPWSWLISICKFLFFCFLFYWNNFLKGSLLFFLVWIAVVYKVDLTALRQGLVEVWNRLFVLLVGVICKEFAFRCFSNDSLSKLSFKLWWVLF